MKKEAILLFRFSDENNLKILEEALIQKRIAIIRSTHNLFHISYSSETLILCKLIFNICKKIAFDVTDFIEIIMIVEKNSLGSITVKKAGNKKVFNRKMRMETLLN